MANSDKNILITPNRGSASDPTIVFSGANATVAAQNITLTALPINNGTVSFAGSAGQLFSITNSLTGTIFSVNDISGIPSIEVNSSGVITLAQYGGSVGIGTSSPSYKLQVSATAATVGITSTTAGQTPFLILNNTADSSNSYIFCPNKQLGIVQADTSASSIVYFSTQNTERMRISSAGLVTMPYQPRFSAYRSVNQTGYNAADQGNSVVIYNATTQNVGSHYSTATGKFTAPVAGMYAFQAGAYSTDTPFNQAWLVINGARAIYADFTVGSSGENYGGITWIYYLNANDNVGFHVYNGSNTNQTIIANSNHTWFRGYLIS